jgi:hypothetical protein
MTQDGAAVLGERSNPLTGAWQESWQRALQVHARGRWWRPLLAECRAADPALFDDWSREFLLGLAEQDDIQPDQLSILSELTTKVRAATLW